MIDRSLLDRSMFEHGMPIEILMEQSPVLAPPRSIAHQREAIVNVHPEFYISQV
jgi:hypothetical protein